MLKVVREHKLFGIGTIEDEEIVIFNATINTDRIEDLDVSSYINDSNIYDKNKTELRVDQINFEDMAYGLQQAIIAENG